MISRYELQATTTLTRTGSAVSQRQKNQYRPEFPIRGFADLDAAREWGASFGQWYNHGHSGIGYPLAFT
jgi:hypothetical protein